mmetsp:Transcript_52156/g.124272  ORF Transcript_52156/g.124272 Transcript_52156/m.124272 type:complete len:369 (+) Transcript_52156:961-2067(+)
MGLLWSSASVCAAWHRGEQTWAKGPPGKQAALWMRGSSGTGSITERCSAGWLPYLLQRRTAHPAKAEPSPTILRHDPLRLVRCGISQPSHVALPSSFHQESHVDASVCSQLPAAAWKVCWAEPLHPLSATISEQEPGQAEYAAPAIEVNLKRHHWKDAVHAQWLLSEIFPSRRKLPLLACAAALGIPSTRVQLPQPGQRVSAPPPPNPSVELLLHAFQPPAPYPPPRCPRLMQTAPLGGCACFVRSAPRCEQSAAAKNPSALDALPPHGAHPCATLGPLLQAGHAAAPERVADHLVEPGTAPAAASEYLAAHHSPPAEHQVRCAAIQQPCTEQSPYLAGLRRYLESLSPARRSVLEAHRSCKPAASPH